MTLRFNIDLGVNTLKGVMTISERELQVEWRRYDLMEAPKGPLESLSVPWDALASVTVRRRPWRPRLEIVAKRASTFAEMPLPAGDLSTLRAVVERADRKNALAWGAEASLRIAEEMTGDTLIE